MYLCLCQIITEQEIKDLIQQKLSFEEILEKTQIGKYCNSCQETFKQFYQDVLNQSTCAI